MLKAILWLVITAGVVLGGAFVLAGRAHPPVVTIERPARTLGRNGTLEVTVGVPGGKFERIDARLEQNGRAIPLFSLSATSSASSAEETVKQEAPDRIRITRPLGLVSVPGLQSGPARITVTAQRQVLYGLRIVSRTVVKDVQVRLEPPRIAVVSTHHHINHGGSEMVVYRATPPDVQSGVRVGEITYPGYDARGAGLMADPALKVAFFALLHDQDLNAPISAFAEDEAGNRSTATFEYRVFPKPFKRSSIQIDDAFLSRALPPILESAPELRAGTGSGDELVSTFLKVNGELRRLNAERIMSFAKRTSPRILWTGPFVQLGNSQVESSFADHRTYYYKGMEIDQQVHLGFDLAVTSAVPIVAANDGVVVNAEFLGIYGNCVILDHGMGVQSLYGHLSSFDVKVGDPLKKGQPIGRSGMTGLAAGDHLHFTMLVNGHMVTPVEWWDPHWIEDRIMRKLREARTPQSLSP